MAYAEAKCEDCCAPFGDGARLIETKSVTPNIIGIDSEYPFKLEDGCGCESGQVICSAQYTYYKTRKTDCPNVRVRGFEKGDADYDCGCSKTETTAIVSPDSESKIKYYTCKCEGEQYSCNAACEEGNEAPESCSKKCTEGDRHISDKLIEDKIETKTNGAEDCCCVGLGEDACEGDWYSNDPRIVSQLTASSCTFQAPYPVMGSDKCYGESDETDIDGNPCWAWASTTITYSDGIDITQYDPTSSDSFSKFQNESYPSEWNEVCPNWSGGNGSALGLTTYATGIKNLNISDQCPSFITKDIALGAKYKIRWRLQIPSSCYIKIWVCQWQYTSEKEGEDTIIKLTGDELDLSEITVPITNGKCFDNELPCSDKPLWNAVSKEFELDASGLLQYPKEDPTSANQGTSKTTTVGAAIVGISYVDGWTPPLFKYSSEVWSCRAKEDGVENTCPYSMDYISETCWPIGDERTKSLQEHFEQTKNIVTCDAP